MLLTSHCSVLFGMLSVVAIGTFIARIFYLRGQSPHGLGRTKWIYWPTQICMVLGASLLCLTAQVISRSKDHSPVFIYSCVSMGAAWILGSILNYYEHRCEIRSSSALFAFYILTIGSSLSITNTLIDLQKFPGPVAISHIASTAVLFLGFVVEAWPRGSTKVQRLSGASRYNQANLFSRLVFFFMWPVISVGLKRTITVADIANQLPEEMKTEYSYYRLSRRWSTGMKHKGPSRRNHSLFWTILSSHWRVLTPILASRVAIVLMSYAQPALLGELLAYFEDYDHMPRSYGVVLAIGMFSASLGVSLFNVYNRYQLLTVGVTTRAALISMIYRKSLRLSPGARQQSTQGEIMSHMSVDADCWWDCLVALSVWISIPLEIGIALWMLHGQLGWTMMAGVLVMLLLLPIQAWQGGFYKNRQRDKLLAMDQRIRLTAEVLASMKVVKLYGWTSAFLGRILSVRNLELQALRRIGVVQAFMSIVFISSSLIISLVTFTVYTLWGGPNFTPGRLTPQTVFVSMTLFGMLRGPIANLSDATIETVNVIVGTNRIQQFLLREEIDERDILRFSSLPMNPEEPVISIKNGTFSWTGKTAETSINNSWDPATEVNETTGLLSVQCSSLNSASSTSSLFSFALNAGVPALRDIDLSVRNKQLTAVVGRVGQGKSSLLSAIIGDMYKCHGQVQISGKIAYVPQQAWIINATLKNNILFGNEYEDDRYKLILSACGLTPDIAMLPGGDQTEIGERGINLSGGQKQRVSLARAAYADADIYLLDDPLSALDAHVGRHVWDNLIGPEGLLKGKARVLVTHGIFHLKHMDQIVVLKDGVIAEKGPYHELMASKRAFYQLIKEYSIEHSRAQMQRKGSVRSTSKSSFASSGDVTKVDVNSNNHDAEDNNSSETEETTDLSASDEEADDDDTRDGHERAANEAKDSKKDAKAGLITAEKLQEGAVDFQTAMVYVRSAASERMHQELLEKILRLPMAFFDTTPLGRILNRFSADIATVDTRIPNKLMDILLYVISVASTLLLVVFTTPSFLVLVPFLIFGYWTAQHCFLGVSRTLARIYSASKSPIFQHFNETLGGISTLRAMKIENQFIKQSALMVDKKYSDLKVEAPDKTFEIPPNWPDRGHITFKNYSTRYREGLDLVIKNISLDIKPGEKVGIVGRTGAGKSSLTLALFRIIEAADSYWAKRSDTSVTLDESETEREQPLMEQEDGGSIEIDGIDIATVGLQDLRQHLAIIPQDPTLFAGTVRENLDPFDQSQDVELWEALERAHLKEYIMSLPGGLAYEVSQNGENFSVGQRSLICLARALLRKAKILILDEATAAVDVETDELIQRTIRKEFKDRTILTIAHRIKTVMDFDKILVLEQGRMQEYESPQTLLLKGQDSNSENTSMFYQLAKQSGEI
ncbi:Multidrug resistance-associated protein 1 [Podila horticola]|nr:Multidrug resistance-associated protein 1 [Podila horticola]